MTKNTYFKNNLIVSSYNVILLIVNFLLQLVVAYYYGVGIERDAYFAAITIPTYISSVFIGSFGVIFLPHFIRIDTKPNSQTETFISKTLSNIFFILTVLSLCGVLFAKETLRISVPGFNENEILIAASFLQILFPSIIFQIGTNIVSSILQSKNKFSRPAFAPIVAVIIPLIFIVILNPIIGIKSLAIGTLFGYFISFVYLFWGIKDFYKFSFDFKEDTFLRIIKISLPLFFSGLISRAITVFERMLASTLPDGSISYLGYSNQLVVILSSITIGGISTTFFPAISKAWAESNLNNVKQYYENGLRVVLFLTVPITLIIFSHGDSWVQIIYERGKFNHHTTEAVYLTLCYLTIAYVSNSLGNIVSKVFYLSGRTLISSLFEIFVTVFYVGVSFILIKYDSYIGLALASSIGACLSVVISIILNYRILKGFNIYFVFKGLIIVIISSGLAFLILEVFPFTWISIDNLILVTLLKSVIFLFIFVISSYFFKLKETHLLVINLKNILLKTLRNVSIRKT